MSLEWVTGVERQVSRTVLHYGVFRRGEQIQPTRQVESQQARPYTYDSNALLLCTYIQLYDLPAHPDIVLMFQLYSCLPKKPKTLFGWTVL